MDHIRNIKKDSIDKKEIALVYGFDTTAWNNFRATTKATQSALTQAVKTNVHTNTNPHSNTSPHSNYGYHNNFSPHSNGSPHTNTTSHSNSRPAPHSNAPYHDNRYSHYQSVNHNNNLGHSNGHSNKVSPAPHTNSAHSATTGGSFVGHANSHNHSNNNPHLNVNVPTHSNASPHTNGSPHSNHSNHNNSSPHNNNNPHSNGSPHSNSGFNHTNFIPNTPEFFAHANGSKLKGNVTLAIFSYDHNNAPAGTNTVAAREVFFDLQIRKIANLDGTANISAWRTLVNNTKESSYEAGMTFDLNTMDPLNASVTTASTVSAATAKAAEGTYEIRAVARNVVQNGVTYESAARTITVTIQQNTAASASVTNTSEFVNFFFGPNGSYSSVGPVKKGFGTTMYSDPYANNHALNNGIFIKLNMTDPDVSQYQTATAVLKDAVTNAVLATEQVYWSENPAVRGTTSVQSGGVAKTGYVYFDKSVFGTDVNKQFIVEVNVRDFENAALTTPTGDVTTFTTFTSTGGSSLTLNIDTRRPTVTPSRLSSPTAYRTSDTLTITPADTSGSGVHETLYREQFRWDNGTIAWSAWKTYTAPVAFAAPAGRSGQVDIEVKTIDRVGNESITQSTILYLDYKPPVGTVSINDDSIPDGANYTIPQSVGLTLSATDEHSGVVEMRFSNDGATWSAWETYSTAKTWTLSGGNGNKTVHVQYRDAVGNISATATDTIVWDNVVPTGSITINSGATFTVSTNVTLTLSASDITSGVAQMQFRNGAGAWSTPETYATSKAWTLPVGDGLKTVGVRFIDAAGNVSLEYTDTITLDTVVPTGTLRINNNDPYTRFQNVTLTLTGVDATSGVESMRFSNDNVTWSGWEAFNTSKAWTLSANNGLKTVYMQLRDTAGNVSTTTISDDIIWDNTNPTISVVNIPTTWTNGSITARINTSDLGGSLINIRKYIVTQNPVAPNVAAAGWINIATSPLDVTVSTKGVNYIHVYVEDHAGNFTNVTSAQIKVNDPVVINDLEIHPGDIRHTIEPLMTINGVKTYLIKKSSFTSRFRLSITENDVLDKLDITYRIIDRKTSEVVRTYATKYVDAHPSGNITDTNQVWYFYVVGDPKVVGGHANIFDNLPDGTYRLEVTVTDDKYLAATPTTKDAEDISTATAQVDFIIKREIPEPPQFEVINRDTGKDVIIRYMMDSEYYNTATLLDKYKLEFKSGLSGYTTVSKVAVDDGDGILENGEVRIRVVGNKTYIERMIHVTTETTIVARITDFAGNFALNVINIAKDGTWAQTEGGVSSDNVTSGIVTDSGMGEVVVEENRATINYFINIRKTSESGLNLDVFKFLKGE